MNEYLIQLNALFIVPERIPVVMIAVLITMVAGMITGPLRGNAYPFLWIFFDLIWGRAGDRLNKPGRPHGDLVFRGFLFAAFGIAFAFILGRGIADMAAEFPSGGATEIAFVTLALTSGSVWFVLLRLYFAMEKDGSTQGAFYGLSRSTRFNLTSTDDFGIVRAGVGFAGVSFDKGLVAPAFWYLIGGLPILAVYSLLSAFAWRFGQCGHTQGFGSVALALEKLMGFVPALLSGFLLAAAAAMTPTARLSKILPAWWAVKHKATYAQGGPAMTALAWPLEVMIGGPVQDFAGTTLPNGWVGPEGATARLDHKHLRRAIYVHFMGCLLFLATLGGAYIASGRLFGL